MNPLQLQFQIVDRYFNIKIDRSISFFHMESVCNMTQIDVLYSNFYKELFLYVQNRMKDPDLTEEIVQDIFVKVCENKELMKNLKGEQTKVWLLKVARNHCIDYWRKSQKTKEESVKREFFHSSIHFLDETIERKIFSEELKNFLFNMLKKLKKSHQQALYLFDIQQFSYKESANLLGISEEAFSSLIRRARRALLEQVLKESNPDVLKLPLTGYELKMLLTWFDITDFPSDIEAKISLKTKDFFNGFNQNFDPYRQKWYPKELEDYLLSFVLLNKRMIAADFGCGTGTLTKKLSPKVSTVYAVDNSREMLNKLAGSVCKRGQGNIYPLYADVCEEMNKIQESIDIGFCCMVLHHIFNPQTALTNIAKTLVPGGKLIIADLVFTNKNWLFKEAHDFWSGFKVSQLRKWIKAAGLEIVDIKENHSYHFQFMNHEDENDLIQVPLLSACCVKK